MGKDGKKLLALALSLMGLIVVASTGWILLGKGKSLVETSSTKVDVLSKSLSNSQYSSYDGTLVSGADVISAIRLYRKDLTVNVDTSSGSNQAYTSSNNYAVTDPTNANYIEPTGNFSASITTNANDTVTTISFDQQ